MNLKLPLKRQWFDMTKQEIKTEDYREINEYWFKRLVFNWRKVADYYNVDPTNDFEILAICLDCFWSKTFAFNPFTTNTMTLGYPKSGDKDRTIQFAHAGIEIRTGRPEWGAEEGKIYFVIKHGTKITF